MQPQQPGRATPLVTYVEVARVDSARGEVLLREARTVDGPASLELRVNGVFVMDTLETGTERALATRSLALVPDPRTVLVGGLGLGYTAHELLADSRVERVVVAELEPDLVQWMREGTVPHGPGLLAEARLQVVKADVLTVVAESSPSSYDLVLLDVDNGPEHLVHAGNAAVYEPAFLHDVRALLTPGGVVALWAANESPTLASSLGEVFGSCTVSRLPVVLQGRETDYLLYTSSRSNE